MKLQVRLIEARLRAPFVSGSGAVDSRGLVLATLQDSSGLVGFGEAAPLPHYDGVGTDEVHAALEDCRDALAAADRDAQHRELLAACAEVTTLPQALAAIDLALWDLRGRRAGEPVWRLLRAESADAAARGPARAGAIEVNATIAAADRATAAAQGAAARSAGFRCVKVKVGLGDDAGRLAAVRAATGRRIAIRVDANGAWSVEEALASLRALEPVGIELCEEPASGLEPIAAVAADSPVAVALDESASRPGALERRVCELICLKVARCGGITGLLDAARRARAAGYEVYLASTLDGPLGIAAALHAAAAIAPDRACGLATLGLFDGRDDPLPARAGQIAVPGGPGLGDGLVEWYGV